jgi:hypothetical protein
MWAKTAHHEERERERTNGNGEERMIAAVVLILVAFIVVGVMLSRQATKTKKRAIADLEAERETVGTFDIFDLVESEVNTLGLDEIEGAESIPHAVLLKIWSDSQNIVDSCTDRAHLRFVIAEGVEPSNAGEDDVALECTMPASAADPQQTTDDG